MAIVFKEVVKHPGVSDFTPKTVYGFEDSDAEDYFLKLFKCHQVDEEPDVVLSIEELDIDPNTIHNESGLSVQDIVVDASKLLEA